MYYVTKLSEKEWECYENNDVVLLSNGNDIQIVWILTSESMPRSMIMKKNRTAHRGATGICATASGYTTNARPGPVNCNIEIVS